MVLSTQILVLRNPFVGYRLCFWMVLQLYILFRFKSDIFKLNINLMNSCALRSVSLSYKWHARSNANYLSPYFTCDRLCTNSWPFTVQVCLKEIISFLRSYSIGIHNVVLLPCDGVVSTILLFRSQGPIFVLIRPFSVWTFTSGYNSMWQWFNSCYCLSQGGGKKKCLNSHDVLSAQQ